MNTKDSKGSRKISEGDGYGILRKNYKQNNVTWSKKTKGQIETGKHKRRSRGKKKRAKSAEGREREM